MERDRLARERERERERQRETERDRETERERERERLNLWSKVYAKHCPVVSAQVLGREGKAIALKEREY
jgi:hypothetical protein